MINITKSLREKLEFLIPAARRRLLNFSQLINPNFEAEWFHEEIASHLERALSNIAEKKKTRLIITIPPRHGKTLLSATYFPAWALGKYPELKFILSTYGAELSEKTGMATRDIIDSEAYHAIFPGITLRPDVKAKSKWMTNRGGSFNAVGVGGAVTGTGADIILVDDPHKNREEAESPTYRENVWEYYRSTLYSRLEGYGAVIIIMQRWHTEDLVGKVLTHAAELKAVGESYDDWEVINYPALALESDEHRKQGDSLWPSKFPLPVLENIRQQTGIYNWASQYMQDPILSESQEFQQKTFRYYDLTELSGKYLKYDTFVDLAISEKSSADNTVVLTIAREVNGPNIYRIREDAGHFTPLETIDLIFLHNSTYRSDVHLETVAYQKALKYSIIEEQKRKKKYFMVHEIKSSGNKQVRIRGLLPLYDAGVIHHLHSDIDYETELLQFPRGRRDDRVDCMSFLLSELKNSTITKAHQFRPKMALYFGRRRR